MTFIRLTVVGTPTAEETEKASYDPMEAIVAYPELRARQRDVGAMSIPCAHCQKPLQAGVEVVIADSEVEPVLEAGLVHPACADEMRRGGTLAGARQPANR